MQSTPNLNSNNVIPVYGANSDPYKAPPTDTQRENGVVPLDSLPAEWWNWLWNTTTMNLGEATQDFNILYTELVNLMTAAGITPSSSSAENVKDAVIALTRAIGDATNPGAVKSSTASGKVAIASDGTCTVNGLGTPSLLDLGDDVVDAINQLNAAVGTVTSTVEGKNIKITYTHNNALSINDNSPVLQEVTSDATNGIKYVFTTVASQLWSYIWGKIKTALGIGTSAKGGTKQPVYFAADGTVTATTETVGSANKPTYRNAGTETEVSDNSVLVNLASTTAASTYGATPRPGVTGVLPVANGGTGAATADAYKKAIIDIVYPVGSVFISTDLSITPPQATGVTWYLCPMGGHITNVGANSQSASWIYIDCYRYYTDTALQSGTPNVTQHIGCKIKAVTKKYSGRPFLSYEYTWTSLTSNTHSSSCFAVHIVSAQSTSDASYLTAVKSAIADHWDTGEFAGVSASRTYDPSYSSSQLRIPEMPAHTHSTSVWNQNGYFPGSNGNGYVTSGTSGSTGSSHAVHAHPEQLMLVQAWVRYS